MNLQGLVVAFCCCGNDPGSFKAGKGNPDIMGRKIGHLIGQNVSEQKDGDINTSLPKFKCFRDPCNCQPIGPVFKDSPGNLDGPCP